MAALKHSLKIALHVYDALQNLRCLACRRSIPTEERRNIGLGYFKYGLCALCFEALTTVCTEQDDTLAEQRCAALTDDGVHAAAMLLSAYRAGAECRLSQADAAWVRNVIADSANFLLDLLREVPWLATRLPTSVCGLSCPAFRASAGRKSCQNPDQVQRGKKSSCWPWTAWVWMTDNNHTMFTISCLDERLAVEIWCNAWTLGINHLNTVNVLWSRCTVYHKLHLTGVYNIESVCAEDSVC